MTSKKDQTSSKKDSNKQGKQPNDSAEDIAMLIKRAMAAEMETFQETVALMLNESLEKALDPLQKHMAENGNILRSLKEQADIHAKKFSTVFNQIDSIQVSLRKTEKETSFWRERGKRNQLYLMAPSYSSSLTTAPGRCKNGRNTRRFELNCGRRG